jgi:predicted amidohydrolase
MWADSVVADHSLAVHTKAQLLLSLIFFRNAACPQAAKEHGIYIVGGSVPEVEVQSDGTKRVYNTSITVDPTGRVVAKHRKV